MAELRRFRIERTEIYIVDGENGIDAIERLDEMDADDEAACYEERHFKVEDFNRGVTVELPEEYR